MNFHYSSITDISCIIGSWNVYFIHKIAAGGCDYGGGCLSLGCAFGRSYGKCVDEINIDAKPLGGSKSVKFDDDKDEDEGLGTFQCKHNFVPSIVFFLIYRATYFWFLSGTSAVFGELSVSSGI